MRADLAPLHVHRLLRAVQPRIPVSALLAVRVPRPPKPVPPPMRATGTHGCGVSRDRVRYSSDLERSPFVPGGGVGTPADYVLMLLCCQVTTLVRTAAASHRRLAANAASCRHASWHPRSWPSPCRARPWCFPSSMCGAGASRTTPSASSVRQRHAWHTPQLSRRGRASQASARRASTCRGSCWPSRSSSGRTRWATSSASRRGTCSTS